MTTHLQPDPLHLAHRVHVSTTATGYEARCVRGWSTCRPSREQRQADIDAHLTVPRTRGTHGRRCRGRLTTCGSPSPSPDDVADECARRAPDLTWSQLVAGSVDLRVSTQADNEQSNDTNDTNTTENALTPNDIPHAHTLH